MFKHPFIDHPRYRPPVERIISPVDGIENNSFKAFLVDHRAWGIQTPRRRMVWSTINGIFAHHFNPTLAEKIVSELSPDTKLISLFNQNLDNYYNYHLSFHPGDYGTHTFHGVNMISGKAFSGSFRNPVPNNYVVAAISKAHDEVINVLSDWSNENKLQVNMEAWYAFAFCCGVKAKEGGWYDFCRDSVEREKPRVTYADTYLSHFVIWHAMGYDYFKHEDPLLRFFASCYPTTIVERSVIPLLFARIYLEVSKETSIDGDLPKSLFSKAIEVGISTAEKDQPMLKRLLDDIEEGIGAGCCAKNAEIFKENLQEPNSDAWDIDYMFEGTNKLIKKQHPLLGIDNPKVNTIHQFAYIQRLTDTGFWAGLYLGCPNAFEQFETWCPS